MTSHDNMAEFIDKFVRIVNKYKIFNKRAFDYGVGDPLYTSEIHTLASIQNHDPINITELAAVLGVTKSAISQVAAKLEKKGLLEKYKGNDNEKNILLRLTPKGDQAVAGYIAFRTELFADLTEELETMDQDRIDFLQQVFDRIDHHMDYKLEMYKP
jgi:DNA-binding MarR family transcriptional regulator